MATITINWESWGMGGGGHWLVADVPTIIGDCTPAMVIMSSYSGDMGIVPLCQIPGQESFFTTQQANQLDEDGWDVHFNGDTWLNLACYAPHDSEHEIVIQQAELDRIFGIEYGEELMVKYVQWMEDDENE